MSHWKLARATLLLSVIAAASLAARGETLTLNLDFETQQQSIWGPGAAVPSTTTYTLLDPARARFNQQSPGYPGWTGPMMSFDTYLFGEVDLGVAYKGNVGGSAGLWSTLNVIDPGSLHVKYPVEVVLDFPDSNSFRAGDTVHIESSYAVKDGWKLETTSPKFTISADAEFKIDLDFQAKAELLGASYSTNDIPGYASLGLPLSHGPGRFNIFTLDQNSSMATPPQLSLLIPLSAKIHVPNVSTTATLDGRSLRASGTDVFGKLDIDVDKVFTTLGKLPPLGVTASFAGVSIDTHLFSLKSITTLTAEQDVSFDPDLKVQLQFAEPLEHWTTGPGGDTPHVTAPSVEMRVGETLHVKYPETKKQPTAIDSSFRLDNKLSSKAEISVGEDVPALALKLGIKVPSFEIVPKLCTPGGCVDMGLFEVCVPEICTPSVDFPGIDETHGPVWNASLYQDAYTFPALVDDDWTLGGFPVRTGTEFSLDPENPIIAIDKVVAATRNLGGGHRTVAYMLTLSNPGDVALSNVHVADDLAAAYPGARSHTVDRVIACNGLTLNGSYGPADDALLGSGNTLAPAATKRVAIMASIYPQANPPAYVNTATADGTSPLDTFVTATSSAGVTLGPAVVTSVDDHVVFGDHFVKIESIADSTGTIGSNDFVEVKYGPSGTLAGDLRAGRFIKVQGTMTADYAFSGGIVDSVGNGALTLSGDAKEFVAVQPFTVPTATFAPTTPFAGDVFVAASGAITLPAGSYGRVTVNRNATLRLSGGEYFFEDLSALPDAAIVFTSGGSAVVRNKFDLGAAARIQGPSTHTAITVLQPGEVSIGKGAQVRGVLSAPRANVTFDESSRLEGAVYGKSVTLRRGVSVSHHVTCNPAVDPNCDGVPDCL